MKHFSSPKHRNWLYGQRSFSRSISTAGSLPSG